MKILAPAGNFDSLKLAVFNGADEVYLGINDFNARNNIDGFTLSTLKQAVDFCHVYDVKVCLAVNILFNDDELFTVLNTVISAYNFGVDYFIVQDLGLARLIKKYLPNAVLHASTQMAIHNLEGALTLKEYGFKRIVLARETPLEEIKRIKENCDFEIEYFCHGALCVSFSGNCYLSSYLHNASGNRGKCKQLCRLPYALKKDNKTLKEGYLLSAKDFNFIDRLKELQDAKIDVIKIEGRARRPFYVATVTKQYKNALNNIRADKNLISLAFNRGFTAGYFDGNDKIISDVQNHIGIKIGKITKISNGKNFNEVFFTSNTKLSPKSTFKIFDKGIEKAVLTAYDLKKIGDNIYKLTTTAKLSIGDDLSLIIDYEAEKTVQLSQLKRELELEILLKNDCTITAKFLFNGKEYTFLGDVLSEAISSPISIDEIKHCFSKNEFFNANLKINYNDSLFIAKAKLNEFRRNVYESVFNVITKSYEKSERQVLKDDFNHYLASLVAPPVFNDFYYIEDKNELNDSIKQKNIVYSPETYSLNDILSFKGKCQSLNKTMYLDLPNFALKVDITHLQNIINECKVPFVANNYYSLKFAGEMVIGAGLNVYNKVTSSILSAPYMVAEIGAENKHKFPYMTLRHCPYKNHLNASCKSCPYKKGYYLQMQSGKKLYIKRKKLSSCTFYLTD